MLILNKYLDMKFILWHSRPKGIIEVGAYTGKDWKLYDSVGVKNRCWIEADPESFKILKANVPETDVCINAPICEKDKPVQFHVTSNFQSSSILNLKRHAEIYPQHKETGVIELQGRSLDSLVNEGKINMDLYDFLLMDVQGAERFVLQGFKDNIHRIKSVVAEVNYTELYEGCMLIDEFDIYMEELGFKKIISTKHEVGLWGDAYYKRKCT